MPNRDPLSVAYDPAVRPVLIQAIRHLRSKRRGPLVWIASTRAELRQLDKGGRTRQERAFMRSAYYHTWREPLNRHVNPPYALTMDWGTTLEPSSRGRFARAVRVTLHKRGVRGPGGGKPVKLGPGQGWVGFQSMPDNRIDS